MPVGTPNKSSKSQRSRRDRARDTEGLEARMTARLITPEVKSGCFERKQRTHPNICPVVGAYAAPKQKGSADGADIRRLDPLGSRNGHPAQMASTVGLSLQK
jgi:hypothetical protein